MSLIGHGCDLDFFEVGLNHRVLNPALSTGSPLVKINTYCTTLHWERGK